MGVRPGFDLGLDVGARGVLFGCSVTIGWVAWGGHVYHTPQPQTPLYQTPPPSCLSTRPYLSRPWYPEHGPQSRSVAVRQGPQGSARLAAARFRPSRVWRLAGSDRIWWGPVGSGTAGSGMSWGLVRDPPSDLRIPEKLRKALEALFWYLSLQCYLGVLGGSPRESESNPRLGVRLGFDSDSTRIRLGPQLGGSRGTPRGIPRGDPPGTPR